MTGVIVFLDTFGVCSRAVDFEQFIGRADPAEAIPQSGSCSLLSCNKL